MPVAAAPRQTGLKRLAVALGFLCLVLFLLAIENRHAIEAWRALRDEAVPAARRVADWAIGLPSGASEGLSGLKTAVTTDPRVEAADASDVVLAGEFGPADDVTRAVTGALAVVGADLRFETGDVLRTRPVRIAAGREVAVGGRTFAERWNAPADAQIELRRVVPSERARAVAASAPCAGEIPGAVALLHRRDRLDMMVFRAGANVGPDAPPSALCGLWSFRRR
ncbi:hypothetical protein [Brevundimonas sp. Root1423]|uniref:hypothetical protein n=1 Tax=Brevundimonas sp. Root1423 TaxID=1736462 RepID=UPI0006FB00B4|nr:hypothetical protein [Brevundimonas sp. Root1423]KQY89551.1 hypothetical protein ASD25_02940 [Brevundimonas sp. Root1423]